jgi:transcriptional regulator with XRE-family HTH domain
MDNINPPNVFRLLRIAKNVQIKDLADQLRVTPAYINAIENGTRTPSKRLIRDYAETLDVDENIILTFHERAGENTKFERMLYKLLQLICE